MSSNYRKYTSTNPVQTYLIERFLGVISEEISQLHSSRLLDVGCGEGFVVSNLFKHGIRPKKVTGFDYSEDALAFARVHLPSVEFIQGDARHLPFTDNTFDTVLCLEVLEHIEDFSSVLHELLRVSSRYLLVSVPWEPWFSYANALRGKNIFKLGRDPEHINAWSKQKFRTLFYNNTVTIKKHYIQFPWQIAVIEK